MKKTNILFIITDDQGYWSLGSYGNKDSITPTLDRLANNGARFENFFCVSPVCSPARASIFTGRIPSQHGVHDWIDAEKIEQLGKIEPDFIKNQSTFIDVLSKNGYTTCLSGKWHLGKVSQTPECFDYWYAHKYGGGPYYNAPMYEHGVLKQEPKYITDAITDYALEFLETKTSTDKPFYLNMNFTAPHAPWGKNQHPQELRDLFKDCSFESCPVESPHPWLIDVVFDGLDPIERQKILASYFASIVSVDRNIQRVLDSLEKQDELENTLIIFTGDNGMNMGHHGIYGKGNGTSPQNMYDTSVKVPFFMNHLNTIKSHVYDNLYSHYDIRHTILEYVGLSDIIEGGLLLPGKSFKSVLNTQQESDNHVVVYDEYGPVRMIRTKEWKYIHRYPDGPHELYHLSEDIDEKNNLVNDKASEQIKLQLRQKLKEWFVKYVNPKIDGAQLPIYGGGQTELAGSWGTENDTTFGRYNSNFKFPIDQKL